MSLVLFTLFVKFWNLIRKEIDEILKTDLLLRNRFISISDSDGTILSFIVTKNDQGIKPGQLRSADAPWKSDWIVVKLGMEARGTEDGHDL